MIDDFFITEFGPTMVENNFSIIKLNTYNLLFTTRKQRIIVWKSRLIKLKTTQFAQQTALGDYKEINKLLRFFNNKPINYWNYLNITFTTFEYPLIDYKKYDTCWIKSIKIEHIKNRITLESNVLDLYLLVHLIEVKIDILKFYEVPVVEILIGDESLKNWNTKTIFKKLKNINKLTIVTEEQDSVQLSTLLTYPCFGDKDDINIIKIK
jgi:uncharacterized LabA/DUF88 family protein